MNNIDNLSLTTKVLLTIIAEGRSPSVGDVNKEALEELVSKGYACEFRDDHQGTYVMCTEPGVKAYLEHYRAVSRSQARENRLAIEARKQLTAVMEQSPNTNEIGSGLPSQQVSQQIGPAISIFNQTGSPFGTPPGIPVVSEQYTNFPGTNVTICLLKTIDGAYITGESFTEFNEIAARNAAKANALHKLLLISQYAKQRGRIGI